MKVIFLDNDGVICLSNNWGSRDKKARKFIQSGGDNNLKTMPVEFKFDNFDKKAVKVLNEILLQTGAEIIISSDWRFHATLQELGEYYISQGIIKNPIGVTCNSLPGDTKFFDYSTELEETRSLEIKEYLKEHPEITHWVAVDDLDMSERFGEVSGNFQWGLKNFVHTPKSSEGIKQCVVKDKILSFLK